MKKVYLFVKFILVLAVIVGVVGMVSSQQFKDRELVVSDVTTKMLESWQEVVIIKYSKIVYRGNVSGVDSYLLEKPIKEIANCEDRFAITIIIE